VGLESLSGGSNCRTTDYSVTEREEIPESGVGVGGRKTHEREGNMERKLGGTRYTWNSSRFSRGMGRKLRWNDGPASHIRGLAGRKDSGREEKRKGAQIEIRMWFRDETEKGGIF